MSLYLDLVTLIVTVVFAVIGATSGFIRELFRLAGLVVGFFVAFLFYRDLQSFIVAALPVTPSTAAAVMAFLIIFIAVFLAIIGVGFLLRKFTDLITLGWLDRLLGALFGAFKVWVVVWAVCLSISSFPERDVEERFGKSVVYSIFKSLPRTFNLESLEGMRNILRGRDADAPPQRDDVGEIL